MCKSCLENQLSVIAEYDETVKTARDKIDCECCKSYHNFLIGVNEDYRVLCLTKIKRCGQVCPNRIRRLCRFEEMVKLRIKNQLTYALEQIYEGKNEIHEGQYLTKMNDVKALNDYMEELENSDHR